MSLKKISKDQPEKLEFNDKNIELAKKMINKSFNPRLINKMNDEEAINYLSNLKQIGRWSA